DNYIWIYTVGGARADNSSGLDTTAYIKLSTGGGGESTINIDNDWDFGVGNAPLSVVFDFVQFQKTTANGSVFRVRADANHERIECNQCWFQEDRADLSVYLQGTLTDKFIIRNSVFEGGNHNFNHSGVGNVYIVCCTLINCTDDSIESNAQNIYPINNASFNNADDYKDAFPAHNGGNYPWYCGSDQGAGEGDNGIDLTNGVQDTELKKSFTDWDGGDYRITDPETPGASLCKWTGATANQINTILAGLAPTVDILGNARRTLNNQMSIGAFAFEVAAGALAIPPTDIASASAIAETALTLLRQLAIENPSAASTIASVTITALRSLSVDDIPSASQISGVIITAGRSLSPADLAVATKMATVLITALRQLGVDNIVAGAAIQGVLITLLREISLADITVASTIAEVIVSAVSGLLRTNYYYMVLLSGR
ncbi:unnamed protein product, partial [marine sediment metagenome]